MTDNEFDQAMAEVREFRRKEFAVSVEPNSAKHQEMPGAFILRISHNGRQWNSVSLTTDEAIKVCAALLAHVAKQGATK